MSGVEVTISDADYPEVREVDLKLIELARTLQGKIVTNDFNLNKVAQLRGVEVLNINELANALKPVVLPGEIMKVFILKEGKEYNQGVAYLDDGTMVVVDNARKMISKTIDVVVTSVLQTTAGKMIFGRYIDPKIAQSSAQGATSDRDEPRRSGRICRRVGRIVRLRGRPTRCRTGPKVAPPDRGLGARGGRRACRRIRRRADGAAGDQVTSDERRVVRFNQRACRLVAGCRGGAACADAVPLVAHGLLADPLHQRLHHRSRHAVDRLEPSSAQRLLRALVCALVVVADSGDDRRARAGARPRSPRARPAPMSSWPITRASTTSR